jgi:hypothetical protein
MIALAVVTAIILAIPEYIVRAKVNFNEITVNVPVD